MAASSSESVEYKALNSFLYKLVTAFKGSHLTIANELVAKGVIPRDVLDKELAVGVDDATKATSIVKSLLDQVQVCPGKYHDFMTLPSFNDLSFRSLHKEITGVHESLKEPRASMEETLNATTVKPRAIRHEKKTENESDDVFCCPCGQCSLDQYLDQGCPTSNSEQFPYLDVYNLDEADREDLTHRLLQDITDMIKRFADLIDTTRNSLNKRRVSVQNLIARALSLGAYDSQVMFKPLLSEDNKELKKAETVARVFIILQPHMSFFNHELLKHITDSEELCTSDDRKRMEEYCTRFNDFCRRKSFEVPPCAFGQSIATAKKSKRKAFAVLITKQEERNLIFVNETKHKIASILKLKSSTLHLHRIDEGSIILVFSVPDFVAREIFPLEPSTDAELKSEGFHIAVPLNIKDHVGPKYRRLSWPLEECAGTKVSKSFSHDSLPVKEDSDGTTEAQQDDVDAFDTSQDEDPVSPNHGQGTSEVEISTPPPNNDGRSKMGGCVHVLVALLAAVFLAIQVQVYAEVSLSGYWFGWWSAEEPKLPLRVTVSDIGATWVHLTWDEGGGDVKCDDEPFFPVSNSTLHCMQLHQ